MTLYRFGFLVADCFLEICVVIHEDLWEKRKYIPSDIQKMVPPDSRRKGHGLTRL
jgi:hypothetical protein